MTPIDTRPGSDQDVGVRSEHGQLQSSDLVLSVNLSSKEREKGARGGDKHDIKKSRQAKCGHLEDKTFLVVSLILSLLKCLTLFFFVNFGILK